MNLEPMKCANCGISIAEVTSEGQPLTPAKLYHIRHENLTTFVEMRCYLFATPPLVGIKSEDIKPDERPESDQCANCGHNRSEHIYENGACRPGYVCFSRCNKFADDPHELPPLPTSREWLEEDGERGGNGAWSCSAVSRRGEEGHTCGRTTKHSGHHTCHLIDREMGAPHGRWYTDGPFVEAK